MKRIYLDHNGHAPTDPRVIRAVTEQMARYGNPSGIHERSRTSRAVLSRVRAKIATFLRVRPSEVLFTSGGTESMNLLIRGFCAKRPGRIITTDLEHPAIFESVRELASQGRPVTFLSPGLRGAPTVTSVVRAIDTDTTGSGTALIVLSGVNSETGIKLPLAPFADEARKRGIPLVIDGVALLGKEHFTIPEGVSGIGFSGHKIHGPPGTGFIYLRGGSSPSPLFTGGPQEFGLRAGTENLPGIVGLGEAVSILDTEGELSATRIRHLRSRFERLLKEAIPEAMINESDSPREVTRISNISNISFPGIDGESLAIQLDSEGVAVSQGSACASGMREPSRVLLNMGFPRERVARAVRFSFGRTNDEEETVRVVNILKRLCYLYST
ncbi:MAG: cysteine desulfurase family protein [Simkaniaceae bacterium]|nr:cysteine desulfurase family protein [Simkaniaceae bacterium]